MSAFPATGRDFWIRHVAATDSTQDHLFRMCRNGDSLPPSGTVIIAGRQSRGRGREGRTWLSPEGGLYLSILIHESDLAKVTGEPPSSSLPRLPLTIGLAVADLVEWAGAVPEIKWPNDVLVGGKKLAGILCESRGGSIAIGIGLNVREAPIETATALADVVSRGDDARWDTSKSELLIAPLLDAVADRIRRHDTAEEVDQRLHGRDRPARHGGGIVVIRGVAPSGALIVEKDEKRVEIVSGEVVVNE